MKIFPIRTTCYASLEVWLYSTIKTPKTLRKQIRIIYPSLLSFLFLLCRYRFERAKIVWLTSDFLRHHQLASSVGRDGPRQRAKGARAPPGSKIFFFKYIKFS